MSSGAVSTMNRVESSIGKWPLAIGLAALGAAIAIGTRISVPPIHFGDFNAGQFTQQLSPLFLVALLIERSLEVYINAWSGRGKGSASLQLAVDKAKRLPDSDNTKTDKLNQAQDDLSNYKSGTQQITLPIALVLGIAMSALGIRCLGNLVAPDAFAGHDTQHAWFTVADVLLTGALLGGGSDFIHQFITSLTNFVNKPSS